MSAVCSKAAAYWQRWPSRNKCQECKRIYLSALHLAHVPEATRSYRAANSSQNLRVRDVLPTLPQLDTFTGWKHSNCSQEHKQLGNQGNLQRPTVCATRIIQMNLPLFLTLVWANKVCRNLSQRRLTIRQGKQHLNILVGLVKVVSALPVGFPSLFY